METPKTLKDLRSLAKQATTAERRAQVLETAVAFALFTVQDRTDKAEKRLVWWHENGRPTDATKFPPGLGVRYPKPMTRYLKHLRLALLNDEIVQQIWESADADLLANNLPGLSHAKSRFALALAGIGKGACLDVHVMRQYGPGLHRMGWITDVEYRDNKPPGSSKRYAAVESRLAAEWGVPNDPAAGQWAWWFGYRSVAGLGAEEHEPFVEIYREIVK